jgi:hypothetical protein
LDHDLLMILGNEERTRPLLQQRVLLMQGVELRAYLREGLSNESALSLTQVGSEERLFHLFTPESRLEVGRKCGEDPDPIGERLC